MARMPKIVNLVASVVLIALFELFVAQSQTNSVASKLVFRDPFVLKLRVDNQHYYEQHIDKVPYVSGDDVYLFAGDSFGINVTIHDNMIMGIVYQSDPDKADVAFSFMQEQSSGGPMMILVTRNRLEHKLHCDALMTVPDKEGIFDTNILPVGPGLSSYETWPHPIVQLVLRNFRFAQ